MKLHKQIANNDKRKSIIKIPDVFIYYTAGFINECFY